MSHGKNRVAVQDAESFASAAKKLISSTTVIYIGESEIVAYIESNPFDGAIEIKGILKMHMMEVDGEKTSLWQNCALQANFKPADIILNKGEDMKVEDESINELIGQDTAHQTNLNPINYDNVNVGIWVIIIYENEKWLGNVVDKKANQVCVRCLEKQYGVKEPQNLERKEDAIFVDQVFHTDVAPILSQIGANG